MNLQKVQDHKNDFISSKVILNIYFDKEKKILNISILLFHTFVQF